MSLLNSIKETVWMSTPETESKKKEMLNFIDSLGLKADKLRNKIWNMKPSDLKAFEPKFTNFKKQYEQNKAAYPAQVDSFKTDFLADAWIYAWVHESGNAQPKVAQKPSEEPWELERWATKIAENIAKKRKEMAEASK
ncbi:MAG: hypothetical protein ACD_2C00067G0002 [uncultured bacterium (gcode 4)]|uniref:Uncharacterized protein n=1 Tax=uncultured bacterium (gcode 4) TaxID=1234023 RepID=K2G407_9BACT|nr:MAG: hypothetical protein ACD_2C00067G0002 [uncultured bacterium (gcode 4)]